MIPATLVASPGLSFLALDVQLASLGWRLGEESQHPPTLVGEPEWCVYSRQDEDARLHYTFNPVVRLRVLEFHGEGAPLHWAKAARTLPVLDRAGLLQLLHSSEIDDLLLGLTAAGALRERTATERVGVLKSHPDAGVARAADQVYRLLVPEELEEGVSQLLSEKHAAPDRSVVFAHLPDVQQRRQILRWLIQDQPHATPKVEEVLRSALLDPDGEVRVTALLAAARLRARNVLPTIRAADMPRRARDGADERDPGFFDRLVSIVVGHLSGQPLPPEGHSRRGAFEAAVRALTTPPEVTDDATLLLHALTTPLEVDVPPAAVPAAVIEDDCGFRLRRSGLPLVWVAPVEHWLGEGRTLRRSRSHGYFISKVPLNNAAARWSKLPFPAPIPSSPDAAEPHLCTAEEAAHVVAEFARIEDAAVRLPTCDEWEMAARGPDGRRFPWGNGSAPNGLDGTSPWGMARVLGVEHQWAIDPERDVLALVGGPRRHACARRGPATIGDMAAVRLVLAGSPGPSDA